MYIEVTGIHYRILIANCYLTLFRLSESSGYVAADTKTGKTLSCTGATKTEYKRAIEPDISDEVPALAYKKEREVYIMDKIKVTVIAVI